jgi:nucleoside-diphosphate-sugar epimerase
MPNGHWRAGGGGSTLGAGGNTMRIFVTGGSGFVGGHVIERLAAQHVVLAMVRSDKSAALVKRYGATPVRCDLDDVTAEHLAGCDAVVHAAARVDEWGTREQFWSANVDGTSRILAAAQAAGVRRFIHIGTEAALFDGHDLKDVDETYPYPARQRFLYSETKAEAEKRVLAANRPGFETVSLRPRMIWGPRDTTILPAILEVAKSGRWRWLDAGRHETSTVHVFNVTHAVALALEHGAGGQAYFITDDGTRSMRTFLTALAETQGVALPDRSIPGAIARPLAAVVENVWRLFRRSENPPMTLFSISMMSSTVTVSSMKARRELGYDPIIDVERGLAGMSLS